EQFVRHLPFQRLQQHVRLFRGEPFRFAHRSAPLLQGKVFDSVLNSSSSARFTSSTLTSGSPSTPSRPEPCAFSTFSARRLTSPASGLGLAARGAPNAGKWEARGFKRAVRVEAGPGRNPEARGPLPNALGLPGCAASQ